MCASGCSGGGNVKENFMDIWTGAWEIVTPVSRKGQGIVEPPSLITYIVMWNGTGMGCRPAEQ